MIQVQNLKKYYNLGGETVKALDDISFEIKSGEMIAIMGPSGSGKSTLMHILGGLDKPDSGKVIVDDQDIAKLNSRKLADYRNKKIGFVFQTFNLQPHLTATENVELPLIFSKKSRKRSTSAIEALKKVALGDRLKHKPSELSGGQRQRVSVARSIVNKPKILFADEPTGNLDTKNGRLILDLLKDLNKNEGITVIIVTHDSNVAAECDRTLQIKDGKLQS